jgi:ABC-type histidine transport system ATPase subunit
MSNRNGIKVDLTGLTLEEINDLYPYAESGGSDWISEARTVLSRAETAVLMTPRRTALDAEMIDDLKKVVDILDKYRRVKIPAKLKKENQGPVDTP